MKTQIEIKPGDTITVRKGAPCAGCRASRTCRDRKRAVAYWSRPRVITALTFNDSLDTDSPHCPVAPEQVLTVNGKRVKGGKSK